MFRREQKRLRFEALRQRDGDKCCRCRRPMRFDLPAGHDQAPTIEHRMPKSTGGTGDLGSLCLCHGRCNSLMGDTTAEVQERMRLKAEAAQLAMERPRRKMRA